MEGGLYEPPAGCSAVGGGIGGEEAVYTFVAPEGGLYFFTTDVAGADSVDDTVLMVLDGCEPDAANAYLCSEDISAANFLSSGYVLLGEGEAVFVVVDAFSPLENGGAYAVEAGFVTRLSEDAACSLTEPYQICDELSDIYCTASEDGRDACTEFGPPPVFTLLTLAASGPDGLDPVELGFVDVAGPDALCDVEGGTFDVITWTLGGFSGEPLSATLFAAAIFDELFFGVPAEAALDPEGNFQFDFTLCFPEGGAVLDPDPVFFGVFDDLATRGVLGTVLGPFLALENGAGTVVAGGRLSNILQMVVPIP